LKLLDTNVVLRFLTKDDPVKAERVRRLLLKSGEELFLSDVAMAEVVWVLESFYKLTSAEIADKLLPLATSPRISFSNRNVLQQALALYGMYDVDFIDAYHAALGRESDIPLIYSYDSDFDKLKYQRSEP